MKIIRDTECYGLMMIPLFVQQGITRCNVENCKNRPTTIIVGLHPDLPIVGMCEDHYQGANTGTPVDYTFEFTEFDAFKPEQKQDFEEE